MWAKLEGRTLFNPKVVAAGLHGRALWVAAILYGAEELTDGFIGAATLPILGALAGVSNPQEVAEHLVAIGLFESAEGGYRVHDYLNYNPTRESALDMKRKRAEAGAHGGNKKQANALANARPVAKQGLKQNPTPSPSPSPSPSSVSETVSETLVRDQEHTHDDVRAEVFDSVKDGAYSLWEAFCDAAELDIHAATLRERTESIEAAQRLIAAGVTAEEIREYAGVMLAEEWRSAPLTLPIAEKGIGPWRMAGRATAGAASGQAKGRGRGAYTSQADWNAAGQRNPDGTLKTIA